MSQSPEHSQPAFVVGLDASESISRVEGLHLSAEMRADFERMEAEGTPGHERRRYLFQKYIENVLVDRHPRA